MRKVLLVYMFYLCVFYLLLGSCFVASKKFELLMVMNMSYISLAFLYSFIFHDRIWKCPWRALLFFILLMGVSMLGSLFLIIGLEQI